MVAEKIYDLLDAGLPKTIGDLPSTTKDAVAIMEYDGYDSTEYLGMKTSVFQPVVKIVARTNDYSRGSSWVDSIAEQLHKHSDGDFMSILLVGTPVYLGRDEQKLHEFQVTFRTQVRSDFYG